MYTTNVLISRRLCDRNRFYEPVADEFGMAYLFFSFCTILTVTACRRYHIIISSYTRGELSERFHDDGGSVSQVLIDMFEICANSSLVLTSRKILRNPKRRLH